MRARCPCVRVRRRALTLDVEYIDQICRRSGTLGGRRYKSSLVQTETCRPSCLRAQLDELAIAAIRLVLSQRLPLGKHRFHTGIERTFGDTPEVRPRGRPGSAGKEQSRSVQQQPTLPIE